MSKIIAVDFDGTLCVGADWPEIGEPNWPLIEGLKNRKEEGDRLILWTCRDGSDLVEAINWCAAKGLYFDAINDNIQETKDNYGNNPRKVSADIYIDDRAVVPGREDLSCAQYSHLTQERARVGALGILMESMLEERFLKTI